LRVLKDAVAGGYAERDGDNRGAMSGIFRTLATAGFLAASVGVLAADAVKPSGVHVVDGDTIEALGKRIRLVGFDAPELGQQARCGLERMLAARAASRLRQMISRADDIDLQIVECSCRIGTEGTKVCNYGRVCGYLTVDGQDVGDVLIAENLAHPLACGKYSCPPRQSWCPLAPDASD
jgi:endonuclease YncB( thermonuclease family)